MKRKLSTSVVVSAPEFVVPRVPVRNGGFVVPKYRARPHGAERKLLGMTSVSDLRVVPPPQSSGREVESHHPSSSTRSSSSDSPVSVSPVTRNGSTESAVESSERLLFADSVSVSPSTLQSESSSGSATSSPVFAF